MQTAKNPKKIVRLTLIDAFNVEKQGVDHKYKYCK